VSLFVPLADFIALIIALLWIIVTSVMLYRGSMPDPVHSAQRA